jgi:hypothetical protein
MGVGVAGRGFVVVLFMACAGAAGCSSSSASPQGGLDAGLRLCGPDTPLIYPDASGVNTGGCCRPVVVAGACSSPILPSACFRETRARDTSGAGELVTIQTPDGLCFSAYKGFTERLEGPGWVSDPAGRGGGYSVWGAQGLYETDVAAGMTRLVCPEPPDADAGTCP